MADQIQNSEYDEFSVLPAINPDAASILNLIAAIRSRLQKKEISSRIPQGQSEDQFFLKMALNSMSVGTQLFRKRADAEMAKLAAWTGIVKEKASLIALNSAMRYRGALKISLLRDIARLSSNPENLSNISQILKDTYGIIFIAERSFTSMKMDGCTFRLENGVPVVAVSARYDRYDNFWFTLLHELSHVALHYEELSEIIVDDLDEKADTEIEIEANRSAKDALAPRRIWNNFWRKRNINDEISRTDLFELAQACGSHPSIVAGLIRHDLNQYWLLQDVIEPITVRKSLGMTDD